MLLLMRRPLQARVRAWTFSTQALHPGRPSQPPPRSPAFPLRPYLLNSCSFSPVVCSRVPVLIPSASSMASLQPGPLPRSALRARICPLLLCRGWSCLLAAAMTLVRPPLEMEIHPRNPLRTILNPKLFQVLRKTSTFSTQVD
jgi:hypothetical protein